MRRFSVFLTPSAEDFTWTGNLVRELCGKYEEPPFEPHVTVCSGALSDLDELKKAVSGAAGESPFSLRVRGIGFSGEYFRTLYIEFEEHPVLRRIHERIRAAAGVDTGHELFPHLSLLYKEMPLRDKGALARRIVPEKTSVRFDELKIVSPCNLELGWRDTGQWRTLFRVKLGKEALGKLYPGSAGKSVDTNENEPIELPIDGTLDLHTFRPGEVRDLVPDYLAACRERGILQVRIIHGKGTGMLREKVHSILGKIPEVASYRLACEDGGGWGATIVTLRPIEKGG